MVDTINKGLQRHIQGALESKQGSNAMFRAQGIDPLSLQQVAPIDDGVPPSAPVWVVITPFMKGLQLQIQPYISNEFVEQMDIEITVDGVTTTPRVNFSTSYFHTATSYSLHSIRIRFIDRWGRIGPWSTTQTGTPGESADYLINLSEAALNGNLSGLLPNANLAQIGDPAKFADAVVTNTALAAGKNANVLPYAESTFENYDTGAWPPTGVTWSAQATGTTASVITYNGYKWLRINISTTLGSGTHSFVFSNYAQRGIVPGQSYIYSLYVRNTGSVTADVSCRVINAADAAGTSTATLATSGSTMIPADGKEYRVYVKFTASASLPYFRFGVRANTANAQIDVNRFQVEAVDAAKTEPGPFSVPVATFGVMSGKLLAVMDAAIVNAVIGDAAIGTAKISSLVADKISAGNLAVSVNISAGGTIQAGSTYMSNTGIDLDLLSDGIFDLGSNTTAVSSRISPHGVTSTNRGTISFYNNTTIASRGIELIQSNSSATGSSYINMVAMRNGLAATDNSSAYIQIIGSPGLYGGQINMSGWLLTETFLKPHFESAWLSIAAGATRQFSHGLGALPGMWIGMMSVNSDGSNPGAVPNGALTVVWGNITTSVIEITNNATAIRYAKVMCWRQANP